MSSMTIDFLDNSLSLNKDQYAAVTCPPDVPLQILAGPGSGKTKVLTARVAYLVQQKGIPPSQICAVTFTNKAANEMKERLKKLIGSHQIDALLMGTFHALCAKFLRKYGLYVSVPNNFTICDAEESKKIISKLLKGYTDELLSQKIQLKDTFVLGSISKAKAKGFSPHDIRQANKPANPVQAIIARVYEDYIATLKENNSLDFDDLLLLGVKLFTKQPKVIRWCRHVLVDEFQDTNAMQYELMTRLASVHGCVTIVGDPDQSIYGWRSAEVTNLGRMRKDFPRTRQIFLEENYRSTGSILAACLAIVSQDKSRIAKSLRTSHAAGTRPTLQTFASEGAEAEFIALEIKRLIAHSGGMLGWKDFVVLLRYNALSRVTEAALQKEGIPNRVLAGQKFFERLEIKDILAYLQLIDNPSYTPAFTRAAKTPPRGIGEKTISELTARAKMMKLSPMELAERIFAGTTPDIKPAVKRKLESLVKPIATLRKLAKEGAPVSDLIRRLLVLINYEAHIKKSQQDWETRWENVQELMNFASPLVIMPREKLVSVGNNDQHFSTNAQEAEREVIDQVNDSEDDGTGLSNSSETPLRAFLQASMLSTDAETKDEEKDYEQVTISTCHSAKGLEWPVVFVPAVEQGTFPFYRTDDVEEERRLLYVACTRAQGLLYLSHSSCRMTAGDLADKDLSEFVSRIPRALFSQAPPTLAAADRLEIAKLLGREVVNEEVVQRKINQHNASRTSMHVRDNYSHCIPLPFEISGLVRPPHPGFGSVFDVNSFGASSNTRSRIQLTISSSQGDPEDFRPLSTLRRAHINATLDSAPCSIFSSGIGPSATSKPMLASTSQAFLPSPNFRAPPSSLPSLQTTSTVSLACTKTPGMTDESPRHQEQNQNFVKLAAGKRRLGMGRPTAGGYPNKKPKDCQSSNHCIT